MSRKLKDFIDENRRAFDDDLPSSEAWDMIEKRIDAKKTVKKIPATRIYRWTAVAAVFFIVAGIVYFAVLRKNNRTDNFAKVDVPAVNPESAASDLTGMEPEYAAEAKKIFKAIEYQQQQLKTMTAKQPELYSQFSQDLAALDSSYRVLTTQALQTPGHEVIIKAMLQNLQLQAELLGKQLLIINELNNNKTEKNEKNNNRSI